MFRFLDLDQQQRSDSKSTSRQLCYVKQCKWQRDESMATQLRSAFKTKRHGALSTCSAGLTAPAHCFAILWTKPPDRDRVTE
jgi:hypothetical protein